MMQLIYPVFVIASLVTVLVSRCAISPKVLPLPPVKEGPTMYAVTWRGEILRRGAAAGEVEQIGIFEKGRLNCLAADRANRLFTIHSAEAPAFPVLLEIDPASGAVTEVASLDLRLDVRAATFALDGRLLVIAFESEEGERDRSLLYEVNLTDGTCRLIGDTGRSAIEGLCLGHNGCVFGYESETVATARPWGVVLIDEHTGFTERVEATIYVNRIASLAWQSPELLMGALLHSESRTGSAVIAVNPGVQWAAAHQSIPNRDVRGLEFLPSAASTTTTRSTWASGMIVDASGVAAGIRSIKLESSAVFGGYSRSERVLLIEVEISVRERHPFPLVHPEIEVLEIRDQDGGDLSAFLQSSDGATDRMSFGLWTNSSSLDPSNAFFSQSSIVPLRLPNLPHGQVQGLSVLRLRVHALAPKSVRVVHFHPSAPDVTVLLRKGYEARLFTPFRRRPMHSNRYAEILVLPQGGRAFFGRRWAPICILSASNIGPEGASDPIPCFVQRGRSWAGPTFEVVCSDHRSTPGRTLSSADVIRIEFVTEPDERQIDLTVRDVPL